MDEKTIRKVVSVLRILIIAVGAVLCGAIIVKSGADETFVEGQERYGTLLDTLLYIIYAVGVACGAAALLFGLYFFATNLTNRVGTLSGGGAFILIGLISFFVLADGTVLRAYELSGIVVSELESHVAGGCMYFVYLLGAVAIASVVVAEVNRAIK